MYTFKNLAVWGLVGISLSGCIGAPVVLAGAAGAGGTNVAGSSVGVSQQWDDLTIKSAIFTILNNTPGLNGANVEVTAFNGIVLLLGQVPTAAIQTQLASKVAEIKGVVIVYNQLTVGQNVTFTRFADDAWITSKVKANMVGPVNPLHFKVVTQQGVVYLLGQVTQSEGEQAAAIAAETSGVQKVVKIFNYIAPTTATPQAVPAAQANAAPAATASPSSTSSPAAGEATVTPMNTSSAIPHYAPNYAAPNDPVGPAASD